MNNLATVLDALDEAGAADALSRCCGAQRWVAGMLARRPYGTDVAVLAAADAVWAHMERADILDAFAHHPRIGGDMEALRAKFARTADWSSSEQAAVATASEQTLTALRDGNLAYERRFGHIFIVCASGKSAAEMLALLEARLDNVPGAELVIAAGEQAKITALRLVKLAEQPTPPETP